MREIKIRRLALFEYGENENGSKWFAILALHWGTDCIYQQYGALIEVAWLGHRLIYVTLFWDLSQALKLCAYYFRAGEPVLVALRHGLRNTYLKSKDAFS